MKQQIAAVSSVAETRAKIPAYLAVHLLFQRVTLDVKLNCLTPPTTCHTARTNYVLLEGRGDFVHGGQRDRMSPATSFRRCRHRTRFGTSRNDPWRIYYGTKAARSR